MPRTLRKVLNHGLVRHAADLGQRGDGAVERLGGQVTQRERLVMREAGGAQLLIRAVEQVLRLGVVAFAYDVVKACKHLCVDRCGIEPPNAQLVILGEGSERSAIEAEITRCGVTGRVELPGHVADPASWYRRASCLVISSQSESFGLTAAEALAHGTPVVSTDCGGPSEILAHGRYGRLVPVGDIAALAAALTATLAAPGDPAERRRRAEEFSLETIHRAYTELIDSLP